MKKYFVQILILISIIFIFSCNRNINDYKYKCRYKYKDINLNAVHCGKYYLENTSDINNVFNKDTLLFVSDMNKKTTNFKKEEHYISIHFQYHSFRLVDYWVDSIAITDSINNYGAWFYDNNSYSGRCFIDINKKTVNLFSIFKEDIEIYNNDTINVLNLTNLISKNDTLSYSVELLEFDKKRYYKKIRLIKQVLIHRRTNN